VHGVVAKQEVSPRDFAGLLRPSTQISNADDASGSAALSFGPALIPPFRGSRAGRRRVCEREHGVTFEEAATVFADPLAKVREDRSAAHDEHRMQSMGYSLFGRLLLVVHLEVEDETTIRIISARTLDPKERRRLERE
jgi:hypothetical protein